jgi:DNA sulfur modification protein DndD
MSTWPQPGRLRRPGRGLKTAREISQQPIHQTASHTEIRTTPPFHLMPATLLADFRTQLQREIALEQWQTECRALQPKREQFATAFLGAESPTISPALSDEQITAIRARIETAWASLFHPPPTNCADKVMHPYLGADLRRKAQEFLDSINVGQQEVNDLLDEQRRLQDRIEELRRRITRLEGVDRDGTLSDLTMTLRPTYATKRARLPALK